MPIFPAIINGGVILAGPSADGSADDAIKTDGSGSLGTTAGVKQDDLDVIRANRIRLAFEAAIQNGMTIQQFIDGIVDEFEDEDGVDNAASINEDYRASTDLYRSQSADMTLISIAFTAETQPDDALIVVMQDDVDAVTLNTDIKAHVSRDNGTTYTQATLADEGDFDGTSRLLVGTADISGQPAGTSMRWKLTTANSKDMRIRGVGLQWR